MDIHVSNGSGDYQGIIMWVMSSISPLKLLAGFSSRWCTLVRRGVLASCAYLSLARVNLFLCTILYRSYVCLLAPSNEVVAWLMVTEIVSELDSREELGRSCRASFGE